MTASEREPLEDSNIYEPKDYILKGKIALITGSSRDIGASIAFKLASNGVIVVGNHRDIQKTNKADKVRQRIKESGGQIEFVRADITSVEGRNTLFDLFQSIHGDSASLDILVLNASGPTREINVDAANALEDQFLPKMPIGGKIILMQSVPGHFYGEIGDPTAIPEYYRDVAQAKYQGEISLRCRMLEFIQNGIDFYVVCPPAVYDSSNWRIFSWRDKLAGQKHKLLTEQFGLPEKVSMDQVATQVVHLIKSDMPTGHTELFQNLV